MHSIGLHEPQFDQDDERLVLEALRSSWVSTGGPFVDRFEREVAQFMGARFAVSTCSGTTALQLMLHVLARRLAVKAPFDVLVPTLTFIATANAIVHAGGIPVLVDCAAGSLNIGAQDVERVVTESYWFDEREHRWRHRTSGRPLLAIMPVHIMGWPCPMAELVTLANRLRLPIVDDAAEALGSRFADGRHVGTTSLAAAISFNANKILTTAGGGMIITDDEDFARVAKHLSTTAKTDNLRFVHDEVGFNFRLVNVLAALGCAQMGKLAARLARKAQIAAAYREALSGAPVELYHQANCAANQWLVTAIFRTEASREGALKALCAAGVQARPLWTPIHRQLAFAGSLARGDAYPEADRMWRTALSLPSSPQLKTAEIQEICGMVAQAARASA